MVFETILQSDLQKMVNVKQLTGNLFSADNGGNKITVEILDGGAPATVSGSVYGYAIREDGKTVVIEGTLSGNKASIVLPASAYAVIGKLNIVIKVGTATVGACSAYVYRTTTDAIVDPGSVVPDISELLAQIGACEEATTEANTAATAANTAAANVGGNLAANYSTSAAYAVGDYCIKDGTLYRCTTAITSGENWNSAHWTAAKIGPDVSALKSALNFINEGYLNGTSLIDMSTVLPDTNIRNSSPGATYSAEGFFATDFIPVEASTSYNCKHESRVNFYDSSKGYISTGTENQTSFITPATTAYIRMSWYEDNVSLHEQYLYKTSSGIDKLPFDIYDFKDAVYDAIFFRNINVYTEENMGNGAIDREGNITAGTTAKYTDYLPVIGGKYLVSSYNGSKNAMFLLTLYNANKGVITPYPSGTGDGKQQNSGYILLPDDCAYARVTFANANVHTQNKLYLLDSVDYNPTQKYLKYLVMNDGSKVLFEDISTKDVISDLAWKMSAESGNGYMTQGAVFVDGSSNSASTVQHTGYIPVIGGKYLVSSYNDSRNEMFVVALFDVNKQPIVVDGTTYGDGKQMQTGYIKLPNECEYVVVTYLNANVHDTNKLYLLDSVNYNPSDPADIKYLLMENGQKLSFSEINSAVNNTNNRSKRFYGDKISALGDSVTNGQKWFDGLIPFFGSRPINNGVGGSTVSTVGNNGFCTDARIQAIAQDTDVLLVMGGINDWANNVPLGEKKVTNNDTDTFYGAVNVMLAKLDEWIPNAKIICMGSTYGMYPNFSGFTDKTGIYNDLGLSTIDYGRAFADMCKLNGIESFVIGEYCGWNSNNISTYITFDGAYLHPNDTGGAVMADVICRLID